MKTWRQLEAMAKRKGFSMDRRPHFVALDKVSHLSERIIAQSLIDDADNDRILRAMVEAALEAGR